MNAARAANSPVVANHRKFKYVGISPRCEEERFAINNKPTGRYRARFPVNGRYTTKILKATTKREAIKAAQDANADRGDNFSALTDLYVQSGCLTRKQKFKRPSADFIADETTRAEKLKAYFGKLPVAAVNDLLQIPKYAKWRLRQFSAGKGTRAVDKEVQTLSNIINYAVFGTKQERLNFIQSNRPRYHVVKSPSRARMPESSEVIHQLADHFFTESQNDGRALRSEVFGWMSLFHMFTGVRTAELLSLRLNAAPEQPGARVNGWLHLGRRSKSGINPYAEIYPEFAAMLDCFDRWHADRFPQAKEYFPGPDGPLDETSYSKAVSRAARKLGLPHITPHGFRSYCATKHLRDGKTHAEVAGIIGDKTAALIGSTYADAPGGAKLHWLPRQGLPAWTLWQPESAKISKICVG